MSNIVIQLNEMQKAISVIKEIAVFFINITSFSQEAKSPYNNFHPAHLSDTYPAYHTSPRNIRPQARILSE